MTAPQHPAKRLGGLWIIVGFLAAAVLFALVVKPWECDSVAACLVRDTPADSVGP